MKKFKFKLETVLKERKRIEDLRLREWTLAQRILMNMVGELTALEKRFAEVVGEATLIGGPLPRAAENHVGMITTTESFIQGTKLRIGWKKQDIGRAEKLTEKKRGEYVRASQKRKALEKLKERRLAQHKSAARKQEIRALDDIYIMNGAARRRMEEDDDGQASPTGAPRNKEASA